MANNHCQRIIPLSVLLVFLYVAIVILKYVKGVASLLSFSLEPRDSTITRANAIANYIEEHKNQSLYCLYTFDQARSIVDGTNSSTFQTFEEHLPDKCPFGDLQFDPALVTTLNTNAHSYQLGTHLARNNGNDSQSVQMVSCSAVSARKFYKQVAVAGGNDGTDGMTFEIVVRAKRTFGQQHNQSMTLFSIANKYNGCTDPGFRLDVDATGRLTLIYFIPVLEDDQEACYEQLFHTPSDRCLLPFWPDGQEIPPVRITVTLDPSASWGKWKVNFYMSYADPQTLERVDCVATSWAKPLEQMMLHDYIQGNYRLYIGNSPRKLNSTKQHKPLAAPREYQPLGYVDLRQNATTLLRDMLKQKIMSIQGPQIPKAMRIFGDSSISIHLLGITFPPINEDTPFAWIRNKIDDFKREHGDAIVDYLMKMVLKAHRGTDKVKQTFDEKLDALMHDDEPDPGPYPDAQGSVFDLFHFAMYKQVLSEDTIMDSNRDQLSPLVRFPTSMRKLHIPEDTTALIDLEQLHSVYNDVRLELRELPEHGKLLLFPNKTVVTPKTIDEFCQLPLEYQRKIYFEPAPDENQDNIFSQEIIPLAWNLQPYGRIVIGIVESISGRQVNTSQNSTIDVFVDAVNDPPRPLLMEQEIKVVKSRPILLDLKGNDVDEIADPKEEMTEVTKRSLLLSMFDPHDPARSPSKLLINEPQALQIVRFPRLGRLYDRKMMNQKSIVWGATEKDSFIRDQHRIYPSDMQNSTFSTDLAYAFVGWGHELSDLKGTVVDELWYRLSDGIVDGNGPVYSDVAKVKFILEEAYDNSNNRNSTSSLLLVVRLEEDTSTIIKLGEIEPLAGRLGSNTEYQITSLPQYGDLYQCKPNSNHQAINAAGMPDESSCVITKRFRMPAIVTHPDGWLVYIPHRDYFNLQSTNGTLTLAGLPLDTFSYEPTGLHSKEWNHFQSNVSMIAAFPLDVSQPRTIQLEVINVPDQVALLPPIHFHTNKGRGESVPVPVFFEDPDVLYSGQYLLILEAEDESNAFELGHFVTDDAVLRFCPYERPCTLVRSANRNWTNANDDEELEDNKLHFIIRSQIFDKSDIEVIGSKQALQTALSEMRFHDWTRWKWTEPHTAEFTVHIRRVNATEDVVVSETYSITFEAYNNDDSTNLSALTDDLISTMMDKINNFLWTLVMTLLVMFLMANASCCTYGFWSCSNRARQRRRKSFEEKRKQFLDQVVQNDYEYSLLIMDLARLLLEPNLDFAMCLLRSCGPKVQSDENLKRVRSLKHVYLVQSLMPILESERQGTRAVFRLMLMEYREQINQMTTKNVVETLQHEFLSYPSSASLVLSCFCRDVGAQWLKTLFTPLQMVESDVYAIWCWILEHLALHIADLPAEIVILCRSCAKLFTSEEKEDLTCSRLLTAVHIIFFNHFVGPALLFGDEETFGFAPTYQQRMILKRVAYRFVASARQWKGPKQSAKSTNCIDDDGETNKINHILFDRYITSDHDKLGNPGHTREGQYEQVLRIILTSPVIQESYEPTDVGAADCDLMAMCLMNLHSFIDSNLLAVTNEYERSATIHRVAHSSTFDAGVDDTDYMTRLLRLLKVLSFPLTHYTILLEQAKTTLLADELLWTGFSIKEWEKRAAQANYIPSLITDTSVFRLQTHRQSSTADALRHASSRALTRSTSLLAVHVNDSNTLDEELADTVVENLSFHMDSYLSPSDHIGGCSGADELHHLRHPSTFVFEF